MTKGELIMSLIDRIVARYLNLTERSHLIRVIVYGLTAFAVIFGIDLLLHIAGWSWFREQLVCDVLEAALLGLIAAHLSRLREERVHRRKREIRYLNHHIRNALTAIHLAQLQLDNVDQRATAVQRASDRICSVLEQLSRNEDVSINEETPEKYERA